MTVKEFNESVQTEIRIAVDSAAILHFERKLKTSLQAEQQVTLAATLDSLGFTSKVIR